ncbi:MAG: peptide ABC transporter substrate-binding protein [Treponema sp.]|jgi:peptide/nickel transport system substrate-binding protein|nr:peptide ABC transporter substrate-binding protein [Treponema sp.]
MKRTKTVVAGILALFIGIQAVGASPRSERSSEKVVTIAITNAWETLMPLNSSAAYNRFVCGQIYNKLTSSKGNGEYAPELADSWEINTDSTEITFHLNRNARWHDGRPFTADDVVFTFQLYSNPAVEAVSRHYLAYIAGVDNSGAETAPKSISVRAVDRNTVVIGMRGAMFYETLLTSLNNVFILPKHLLEGKTTTLINAPETWETNPIGTGPFKFVSKIEGERIEYTANTNYFLGAPKFDRLVVRVVPANSLLASLISGEVDIPALGSIVLADWALAQAQSHLITQSVPTTNYQTLLINTEKPYLTEAVRQAISMSINRQALVDLVYQGQGVPVVTPIVPANPYYDPSVAVWYDPPRAREILRRENFPLNQELIFYVPSGNASREQAAVLIQQNLEAVGLKVRINLVDFSTLMREMREGKHDIGVIGSGGVMDPSESREMIHPESEVNFALLKSYELSDIIDKGINALTFETRAPFFNQYQRRHREIAALPVLYSPNTLIAYNKRLGNVKPEDFASERWATWEWDLR